MSMFDPEPTVTSVSCRGIQNRTGFRDTRTYADGVSPRLGVGLIEKSVTALVMQSAVASPSADTTADWAI
jgi:hypothetical protein